MIVYPMTPQLRFAEPPFGNGISPIGMSAPILLPRAWFIDFRTNLDRGEPATASSYPLLGRRANRRGV
jgi:hypothetical protein